MFFSFTNTPVVALYFTRLARGASVDSAASVWDRWRRCYETKRVQSVRTAFSRKRVDNKYIYVLVVLSARVCKISDVSPGEEVYGGSCASVCEKWETRRLLGRLVCFYGGEKIKTNYDTNICYTRSVNVFRNEIIWLMIRLMNIVYIRRAAGTEGTIITPLTCFFFLRVLFLSPCTYPHRRIRTLTCMRLACPPRGSSKY